MIPEPAAEPTAEASETNFKALYDRWTWLRVTLSTIGDGVITTDRGGRVTFLNSVAEALTGWSMDDAAGLPLEQVFQIVNEQTRQPEENPVTRALGEGPDLGLAKHCLLIPRSMNETAIDHSAAPIRDESGAVAGVVLVFHDISDRREVERRIDEARTFAVSVVDTVREPLLILTADLHVRSANRSFYHTFQVSPPTTEGCLVYALGDDAWNIPALRRLLEEVLPDNSTFEDFEVEHDFPSIGPKTMLLNARRLYQEDNRTELILLAIEDITERKQLTAALAQERTRLADLNEGLEGRVRERTEQVRALSNALLLAENQERIRISQVLHDDLQQLLYSQRMHQQWIASRLDTLDTSAMVAAFEQLDTITKQALSLTRTLASDMRPPVLGAGGLDRAIHGLADHMEQEYGLHVDITGEADAFVRGQEAQTLVLQFVRELLFNIVKHAGVEVARLVMHTQDDQVLIEVADEGKGFDMETAQLSRLPGRGLGLSSIEERLTIVDGALHIDSQPGKGTRITLALPRERESD